MNKEMDMTSGMAKTRDMMVCTDCLGAAVLGRWQELYDTLPLREAAELSKRIYEGADRFGGVGRGDAALDQESNARCPCCGTTRWGMRHAALAALNHGRERK